MEGNTTDNIKHILTNLINKIIVKKYPELILDRIGTSNFRGYTIFEIMFLTSEVLPNSVQRKIEVDLTDLFKSASLNYDENGNPNSNSFGVYFKSPGEDEFTFGL
jgi:hypothetical protein